MRDLPSVFAREHDGQDTISKAFICGIFRALGEGRGVIVELEEDAIATNVDSAEVMFAPRIVVFGEGVEVPDGGEGCFNERRSLRLDASLRPLVASGLIEALKSNGRAPGVRG